MEVSVIIPIFNQESYLRECLDSVVSQEGITYEAILINDGSTDGSEEICLEYSRKYTHFRYVYQENMGLGGARNTGLDIARGKYIFFLDSDDTILRNSLQKLVSFAEEKEADMVYFDVIVCDSGLNVRSVTKTYQGMDTRIEKLKALEFSMKPSHVWARLYRRKLFDSIRFACIWYEDMELFPRVLTKAEKLYYYKVPIYCYRQHKQGITYQETDQRNLDVITAWSHVYAKDGYSGEEKNAIETCIKEAVCNFLFFRPKYAAAYAEFYNRLFGEKVDLSRKKDSVDDVDIKNTPLWQQADFYGRTDILDVLRGLNDIYTYGGILQFHKNTKVDFREKSVSKERIIFSADEDVVLKEIRVQRGNPAVSGMLRECAGWNLISLKNYVKEFQIARIVIKNAILYGIRIDERT